MGLQIACLLEYLVTIWTAEWFVSSVDFFMGLQIACLREYLVTLWTAEWFVTRLSITFSDHLSEPCLYIEIMYSTVKCISVDGNTL